MWLKIAVKKVFAWINYLFENADIQQFCFSPKISNHAAKNSVGFSSDIFHKPANNRTQRREKMYRKDRKSFQGRLPARMTTTQHIGSWSHVGFAQSFSEIKVLSPVKEKLRSWQTWADELFFIETKRGNVIYSGDSENYFITSRFKCKQFFSTSFHVLL